MNSFRENKSCAACCLPSSVCFPSLPLPSPTPLRIFPFPYSSCNKCHLQYELSLHLTSIPPTVYWQQNQNNQNKQTRNASHTHPYKSGTSGGFWLPWKLYQMNVHRITSRAGMGKCAVSLLVTAYEQCRVWRV
jgi:hypothetical protein